jgi:hypothetical protein
MPSELSSRAERGICSVPRIGPVPILHVFCHDYWIARSSNNF